MAEQLASLLKKGGDNFPDISDGTNLTIFNNRIVADSEGDLIYKIKVIDNKTYIEVKGKLTYTASSSGYDSWRIFNVPITTIPVNKTIEKWVERFHYPTAGNVYGMSLSANGNELVMLSYGSYTLNDDYHLQMVVY